MMEWGMRDWRADGWGDGIERTYYDIEEFPFCT
jgi:hypothetical protein